MDGVAPTPLKGGAQRLDIGAQRLDIGAQRLGIGAKRLDIGARRLKTPGGADRHRIRVAELGTDPLVFGAERDSPRF